MGQSKDYERIELGALRRGRIRKCLTYFLLTLWALIVLFPFYWMILSSVKSTAAYNAEFTPSFFTLHPTLENYLAAFQSKDEPLGRYLLNTLIFTVITTGAMMLVIIPAAFAFSRLQFRGKNLLFAILLGTMMIPATASMIPWFIMMSKFGWINDYKALIIPSCANAFGIFWMRQYCQNNVPKALMEAARIDGCSEWTIFFHVIAPILKPAYASLGIMNFVNQWNEFTQALLILRKEKYYTLPLLLRSMVSDRGNDYGAIMLASTCAVLPLLIAFLSASKFFMDGLTAGAVKE